ncbi:MAG TPA: hypothetical protein EYP10_08395, partial [Armatimonadetes bacterium]|nr:hypothetical protein [Armatimonadota bacterium]
MKFMEGRFCWLIILMLLSLTASGNHIIGATNQSTQHASHPLQPQAQPSAPTQSMLGWQALTSPSTANLLRNGGFEDGLDSHGVPVSWQFVGEVAPANVLRLDPRASEGKWALRIKPVMVPHDIATVGISQRVAVNPSSSLFVSVDVQSNTQIAPVACFLVIEFQPGITRIALKLTPSINQYQTFEQQVVVPSDAHIMQLTLYVQLHRDLDLLVDNFIVAVTGTQMESGVQRMPQRLWSAQRIMRLQSHTPAFGAGQVRAYQRVIDPNYTVRPGDQLVVQMRSATVGERWMELPVDVQGQVQIPNIGFIRIVGMRVSEVRQMLQMMMQKSYRDPQLELEIVEVRSPTGISTTKFTTTTVGKPPVVQRPSVGIRI